MPSEFGRTKTPGETAKMISLLVLVIYVLVADVVSPLIKSSNGGAAITLSERITRLESMVMRLENVPLIAATQTEAINNLKVSVDKIGAQLDRHITKDIK